MRVNHREIRVFAWALLVAAAVLFLCSKSSPAYPVNDWSDANIYFTIGKGMTQGQVVYRDLYDHKGPLLYALHALCAWVSFSGFFGVYVMEVLLASAMLYLAHRFLRMHGAKSASAMIAVLAVVVYSSVSFAEGDSAEEMALPLMMGTLLSVCAYLRSDRERMSATSLVLNGVLTGCVFWIKFTMIGVHAGLLGWVLLRHLYKKEWKSFLESAGWLIVGFVLSTLPWVIYFGVNGAVGDWLKVYLYDNLFLYSGQSAGILSRVKAMALSGLDWVWTNLRYTALILFGLVWFILKERKTRSAVVLMAALGALAVFVGGKSYPYYGFALAGMTVLGLVPLARIRLPKWSAALMLAVCLAACPLISHNMTADYGAPFGSKKEDTMQHRIAALIEDGASLLNYGFMDAGFYTAAGVVPEVKYFHRTNVPLEEMVTEQNRYVEEGVTDYVVTRQEMELERYELVAEEESPNFWYEKVYLYRRKP
ncbi:MAG: hypothetical protein IKK75_02155 [Clostridia bacterium]|nr:hypothetical protein [Clostridia bacterium]